jgi:hypothetical protein
MLSIHGSLLVNPNETGLLDVSSVPAPPTTFVNTIESQAVELEEPVVHVKDVGISYFN